MSNMPNQSDHDMNHEMKMDKQDNHDMHEDREDMTHDSKPHKH